MDLHLENIFPIKAGTLKFGVIFELKCFLEQKRLPAKKINDWSLLIDPSFLAMKFQTIKTKLNRLFEKKKETWTHKKS